MKKIIAAIDGLEYSESAISYAITLAKLTNAYLVGIFLDDFTRHSYSIYNILNEDNRAEAKIKRLEEKDKKLRGQAVSKFERACKEAGLTYFIHHDRNIAIQELLHESIYADLLVIDNKETLTRYEEKMPSRFIRDLLSEVQCPVLVVPAKYTAIKKIILLYDGEPSSVHASKMFDYILNPLKALPTEILSVVSNKESLHVPDNTLIKEFLKRHYPKAQYTVLKGDPETKIVQYLKKQSGNTLVVAGAYRRGMVSRWFRASMADALMQELKHPLFIAHNK
jgi:nucleotide-binding universal stress UspA family protein